MATNNEARDAAMFHGLYEKYAPEYGYETREDTKEFDPETPNGKLMIRVVNELLAHTRGEVIDEFVRRMNERFAKGDFYRGWDTEMQAVAAEMKEGK
jgi:hypothetical protein